MTLLQPHVRALLERTVAADGDWSTCSIAPVFLEAERASSAHLPFVVCLERRHRPRSSQADEDASTAMITPAPLELRWAGACDSLRSSSTGDGAACRAEEAPCWAAMWHSVDEAAAQFAERAQASEAAADVRATESTAPKRTLQTCALELTLRGRRVDATAAEELRTRAAAFAPPRPGFLSWTSPPAVAPLAYGVHLVRCAVLLDPDILDADAFADALADAIHCDDADSETDESDDDDDDRERADEPLRPARPEILKVEWGNQG